MQVKLLRRVLVTLAALALAGCGPPDHHDNPGVLTVSFTPAPPSLPELTLTSATLLVGRIQPVGNRPPPPPPMLLPPPLSIDATATTPAMRVFDMLPPGVYSRVQFALDSDRPDIPDVALAGTWRGTPFTAPLGMFGGTPIEVRATTGAELEPGHDATLAVRIDVGSWFAGNLLDQAMPSGGQILCDMSNNPQVAGALLMRVVQSFSLP